jgi:peptide/nickel transport system permease protein
MTTDTVLAREAPGTKETLSRDDVAGWTLPELKGLRKLLGPEWYRLLRGVITNPLSVAGLIIVTVFILMAVFAPVLAPPTNAIVDPYLIPRDGFSSEPKPPGTVWERNPPPVPGWYEAITGKDYWVHLMGTTSGQWDIWYGVVWGTRTALFAGIVVT